MIDDEQLAALLDGQVRDPRRAELLARLASSDEDYDVLAETAAVLAALEAARAAPDRRIAAAAPGAHPDAGDPPPAEVLPLRPSRAPRHRVRALWPALAAVLAAAALAPWIWARLGPPPGTDPARVAVALASSGGERGLPGGWKPPEWARSRGAGDLRSPQAQAVRLGVLLVDLQVAAAARDTAVPTLASRTADLLAGVRGGGLAARTYREVAGMTGAPPERLAPLLERGQAAVRPLVPAEWLEAGAWLEGARIAAARGDAVFFASRESRAAPDRLERLVGNDAAGREALQRVRAALREDGPHDWPALAEGLAGLLVVLGS